MASTCGSCSPQFQSYTFIWGSHSSLLFPENVKNKIHFPQWKLKLVNNHRNRSSLNIELYNVDHALAKFKFSVFFDIGHRLTIDPAAHFFKLKEPKNMIENLNPLRNVRQIECTVSLFCNVPFAPEQRQESKCNFIEDFYTLYENKQCYDITLVAEGRLLKAHKAILIARSKVFAAMFQHNMEEHNSNIVTISDISPDVLEKMLCYMYTNKAENIDAKIAEELMLAADKYDLKHLKLKCEEVINANVGIDNAVRLLVLADMHNAVWLKKQIINFIINNSKNIIEQEDWMDLAKSHVHLLVEAFQAMSLK